MPSMPLHEKSEASRARWLSSLALCLLVTLGCDNVNGCAAVLLAQRYDSTNVCLGKPLGVGCTDATSCDESLMWALNPDGMCFLFPSSCVPTKFTLLSPGDPRCPAVSDSLPMCVAR